MVQSFRTPHSWWNCAGLKKTPSQPLLLGDRISLSLTRIPHHHYCRSRIFAYAVYHIFYLIFIFLLVNLYWVHSSNVWSQLLHSFCHAFLQFSVWKIYVLSMGWRWMRMNEGMGKNQLKNYTRKTLKNLKRLE